MDNLRVTPAALGALLSGDMDNFIAASTPGGIEAQEAAGQAMFIASTSLPKEMLHGCTREKLEQMGIKFGTDVDDLFVSTRLPDGWKLKATDHSMWSDLLDENGRKRAAIFYKAAFYDRSAHISLSRRFSVNGYAACDSEGSPVEYGKNTHLKVEVMDGDTTIYVAGIYGQDDYDSGDVLTRQARAWLNKQFPENDDPLAYW